MYKRPARLLVAALEDDGRADVVARLAANPVVAEWMEVRPAASVMQLDPEDLAWADLLVALDGAAARAFPGQHPPTCRMKRLHLPPAGTPGLEAAAATALNCMVGGMRMLSRMDAPEAGG
jgi:hypothetical protein